MKTLLRALVALCIVAALAIAVAAVLVWQVPSLHGTITVDGDTVTLKGLDGLDGASALILVAMVVIGLVCFALLGVVVALAAVLLAVAIALLAAAVSLLVLASPLILVGWLVWLVLRSPPARPPATAATA